MLKNKRMRKVLLSIAILSSFFIVSSVAIFATVSTDKPTGKGTTVYVAGNPDWYPIEYYDKKSKTYDGILPRLLEKITDITGVEFTYVSAGTKDQRQLLAENGQVELVSGCNKKDALNANNTWNLGEVILTVPNEFGYDEVCFAYTKIASESLKETIEGALTKLDERELTAISIQFLTQRDQVLLHPWIISLGSIILLLVIILCRVVYKFKRYRSSTSQYDNRDRLTGSWNKQYFIHFFDQFISDQYRNLYSIVYICFDIVRVNQYYGEKAAEEQLRFAAKELQLSIHDNEIFARVSGGGFAIIRISTSENEMNMWVTHLLQRLNRFSDKYGKDYHPVFKAGIYLLNSNDHNCEQALMNARQGYQQAVDTDLSFSYAKMDFIKHESEILQLKKQTLDALHHREFVMYLQFIVNSSNGKICGAEAVSRWQHPTKGLLFPGSYIDLMENEGTIVELDFYIFEEVCRQLEKWQKEGLWLYISCNFARISICRETFVQRVFKVASKYNFDYSYLLMEITEHAMEVDKQLAYKNISKCKDMGFRIALDDAGSGYTSFADLRDYPIDVVKIDRSILLSASTMRGESLLRGIIALVHSLDMKVLCEGAETYDQVTMLASLECDFIQGYYFYRPLPLSEVERIIYK